MAMIHREYIAETNKINVSIKTKTQTIIRQVFVLCCFTFILNPKNMLHFSYLLFFNFTDDDSNLFNLKKICQN